MKFEITVWIAFLASGLPLCSAWGNMGHEAIAYIASNFVTTPTKTYFQNILADTTTDYLAAVATYVSSSYKTYEKPLTKSQADTYRYTTAGLYSKPYHFIDANDNPPSSCSVEYSRDCESEGCVVSAINNYTSRVQSTTLSAANVAQAAKMIVHFVGDIHQPLHDENLDVGGNDITVTFDGTSTNLHHIWDTNMPEKYAGGSTIAVAKTFATTLTTAIKTGKYESDKDSWLTGIDITDPVATAMVWASDANSFVCSTVLPNGVSAVESVDLAGAYYTAAIPIVEEQIAKAGYRLAAWLNLIATRSTGL